MADIFKIRTEPVLIVADGSQNVTVTNNGPSTIYYGDKAVNSSTNDGSVASGSSVTLTTAKYFVAAASATLQVVQVNAKNGFFGVAPVVRPTAYTQTYSTATKTHANPTASAVVTTGATNSSPYGFAGATQADALSTTLNALIVDVATTKKVLNSVIDDLQALGLLQ